MPLYSINNILGALREMRNTATEIMDNTQNSIDHIDRTLADSAARNKKREEDLKKSEVAEKPISNYRFKINCTIISYALKMLALIGICVLVAYSLKGRCKLMYHRR